MGLFRKKPKDSPQKIHEKGIALYDEGRLEEAHEMFLAASRMGYPRAECAVGQDYLFGEGVEPDTLKALEYLTKSYEGGWEKAAAFIGQIYFCAEELGIEEDWEKAFSYLMIGAKENALCMAFLAKCYYYGWGCGVNNRLSVYWAQKAIDHGESTGYAVLGNHYSSGIYLAICPAYARYCYEMYAEGAGFEWEESLDDEDEDEAEMNAKIRAIRPVKPQPLIFDDTKEDFFTAEDPWKIYIRGVNLLGIGIKDKAAKIEAKEGERLLVMAADMGHCSAMTSLAIRYLNTGEENRVTYDEDGSISSFRTDTVKALKYLTMAARAGNTFAIETLAEFYTYGEIDIEPNKEKAKEYWQLLYQITQDEDLKEDILDDFDTYFHNMMSDFAKENAAQKYVGLGCRALLDGKISEAKRYFKKAVTFESGEGAFRLAMLYKAEKNFDNALLYLKKAMKWKYQGAEEEYKEIETDRNRTKKHSCID